MVFNNLIERISIFLKFEKFSKKLPIDRKIVLGLGIGLLDSL